MFTPRDFVWGIILPALVAALPLAIAWWPRRGQGLLGGFWAGSVALSASFAAAFPALVQRIPIPPREATDWLFVIALGCAAFGLWDGIYAIPQWVRRAVAAIWFAVFDWLLLRTLPSLSFATMIYWIVGVALFTTLWWLWLDNFANRQRGPVVPLLILIVGAAVALVLLLSSSQLLGQLGGVLAAATGTCFIAALFAPSFSLARGGILTFVSLTTGLLICSHFYAGLTVVNGGLLLTAGLLAAAGQLFAPSVLAGWKRTAVLIALVFVPAGAAVALAAVEFAASMAETGYSY